MRRAPLLAGLAVLSLVWGTQFLIIREGQASVPPLLTACVRFAILALVAQAAVWLTRARSGQLLGWRLAFGLAQALAMGLLYVAERDLASSLVAALFATTPLFVALLAHGAVPGERLQGRVVAAMGPGLAGVVLILPHGTQTAFVWLGALAALGAALCSAANKVIGKRLVEPIPASVLLRDMAVVVSLVTGLGWWLFERHEAVTWTPGAIAAVVYLGVVASALASGLFLAMLRRVAVTSMAYLQFATALVGVLTGVLIGGEALSVSQLAGATLIVAGLAVLARRRGSRTLRSA